MKVKNDYNLNENKDIFKYLKPKDNDQFSKMKGIDLQEIISLIDNYYLELRNVLGFNDEITFGLELEFEKANRKKIETNLNNLNLGHKWKIINDSSLEQGAEITSPILCDNPLTWQELNSICDISSANAIIGKKAGAHIHVGAQILGSKRDYWLNFIKIWSVYENIIYRFLYGSFLTARPSMEQYAKPMMKEFYKYYNNFINDKMSFEDMIRILSRERYNAVNFQNINPYCCDELLIRNTIEFRSPNGTLNSIIWQNNVNMIVKLLLYTKSLDFNDDTINKRYLYNLDQYANLRWYDEIYLPQVLEFIDLVFNNNFDKIYFLKQYLKYFQIYYGNNYQDKAQILTKKIKYYHN